MKLKQIRLLPVVIVATFALLLLKGIGLMTNGGYVLAGAGAVQAEEGGHVASAAGDTAPTLTLPHEPTMVSTDPVLTDIAPTLPLAPEATAAELGEAATAPEHDEAAAEAASIGGDTVPGEVAEAQSVGGVPPITAGDASEDTAAATRAPGADCAPVPNLAPDGDGSEEPPPAPGPSGCLPDPGVNAAGDALPLIQDGAGNIVPLAGADGVVPSDDALLERLSARRDELDQRESELDMRMALVEAAEKRIEERTAVLEQLEARIKAMVDEKRTLEEAQFTAVVAMYETMKPKDAAAIFDQLEMPVLLRVARAINPRKMAPIMARMDPIKAKDLTAGLAVDKVEPTIDMTRDDLSALPQIVGQ